MDMLAETAPSDHDAAERSVRVSPDGPAFCVSLETTSDDFFVVHRTGSREDAEFVADAVRHNIAGFLAQHTAQLRAEVERLRGASHHDREFLGKLVRMTWVEWAREQEDPKPHWLEPWSALDEPMREVDRRIGERVAGVAAALADREIGRLEKELGTPRAAAPSPRLEAAIESWRNLPEWHERVRVREYLRDTELPAFAVAAEVLEAAADAEQQNDQGTAPETPEAKVAGSTEAERASDAQVPQDEDDEDVRTFEFLWREYALWPDDGLTADAQRLKRRLLEIVKPAALLPGAALLAAYPHVREIELRGSTRDSAQMVWLSDDGPKWLTFRGDHDTIDEALREAEARAAKAAERTEVE